MLIVAFDSSMWIITIPKRGFSGFFNAIAGKKKAATFELFQNQQPMQTGHMCTQTLLHF
jgi:hypothetical protein